MEYDETEWWFHILFSTTLFIHMTLFMESDLEMVGNGKYIHKI